MNIDLTAWQQARGWQPGTDGGVEVRIGALAIAEVHSAGYEPRESWEVLVADASGAWKIAKIVPGPLANALAAAEAGLVELGWQLDTLH